MITILVVEDDTSKLQKIVSCLTRVEGLSLSNVEDVRDGVSARRRLRQSKYDLLIIDIAIPERLDEHTNPSGGIELLEDVSEQPEYIVPDHIIGLTAFEELLSESLAVFRAKNWHVVHYDPTSEQWEVQLLAQAEHVVAASRSKYSSQPTHESDLVIVCALPDPELVAVRDLGWNWKPKQLACDHTTYFEGSFLSKSGSRSVYAASAPRMGMAAAAALTMKMICLFRPRFVAMAGIAAGIRGEANYGDIVVADQCWDYGSGKHDVKNQKTRFRIAPFPCVLDPTVRSRFEQIATDDEWLGRLWSSWRGVRPPERTSLRIGPVASGSAVIADSDVTAAIMAQHRKLLAIEMESYGVLTAVEQSPSPRPLGFVAKSVCDYADESKDDRYQLFAAYTSAMAIARYAELNI